MSSTFTKVLQFLQCAMSSTFSEVALSSWSGQQAVQIAVKYIQETPEVGLQRQPGRPHWTIWPVRHSKLLGAFASSKEAAEYNPPCILQYVTQSTTTWKGGNPECKLPRFPTKCFVADVRNIEHDHPIRQIAEDRNWWDIKDQVHATIIGLRLTAILETKVSVTDWYFSQSDDKLRWPEGVSNFLAHGKNGPSGCWIARLSTWKISPAWLSTVSAKSVWT